MGVANSKAKSVIFAAIVVGMMVVVKEAVAASNQRPAFVSKSWYAFGLSKVSVSLIVKIDRFSIVCDK